MKIVVDLPNENYQVTLTKIMLACRGCSITELPKEHGRLIDADALNFNADYYEPLISKFDFDSAPTIIGADKAESEGKNENT